MRWRDVLTRRRRAVVAPAIPLSAVFASMRLSLTNWLNHISASNIGEQEHSISEYCDPKLRLARISQTTVD
jgi:hypothetical protein